MWLHSPTTSTSPSAWARAAAATRAGQSSGVAPSRESPVSTSRCTRAVPAGRARGGDHLVQAPAALTDTSTSAASAAAKSVPGPLSQASSGAVIPAARSASASSSTATPSASAPPARTARADGHQAVAVAVGLDHGHERAADPLAQDGGVGGDRVEVDDHLGAGRLRCVTRPSLPGRPPGARAPGRRPPGSRRTRSPAISGPRCAASCPARPCRCAATAAASSRGAGRWPAAPRRSRRARRRCRRWPAPACRCR